MGDKRNTILMIVLLMIFAAIFFISFAGLKNEEVLFGLGIPALFENWLIMFLSLGSIIRIVWELYKR